MTRENGRKSLKKIHSLRLNGTKFRRESDANLQVSVIDDQYKNSLVTGLIVSSKFLKCLPSHKHDAPL
ncbi:hypothetical protein Y032_0428g1296 [Ancylostoma ceylanicum]|uniref:Uncharacterized protein n=1 Tax=Ancylostoma ceylanicum TaxID=53326 RepID=A0A016X2E7_9BILA|nr:hypothetical protein Y032_0428g1296 [Ancylostoma ceylanicum]